MNILHITREQDNDARYGIRKSLLPVIEIMKSHGNKVEIFDKKRSDDIHANVVENWLIEKYSRMKQKSFGKSDVMAFGVINERLTIAQKAAKYAARRNITHVHCHDPLLGFYYNIFAYIYGSTRCWGYTVHSFGRFVKRYIGVDLNNRSLSNLQKMEERAEKKARWIISPTKSGILEMLREFNKNIIPQKWHVVPHVAHAALQNRDNARKKLGLSKEDKLLLAIGRLDPMKRFSLLLEAVALIPESYHLQIIILGEGPEKQLLISFAKKLKLVNKFEIRTTDSIGEYLSAADIYVSVSSTESFGLASCEAVLAEVPSICTNVGAVPELLGNAVILVDDNRHVIAEQIQKLLVSRKQRMKLRRQAKIISKKWSDAETIAKSMENIYLSCNAN